MADLERARIDMPNLLAVDLMALCFDPSEVGRARATAEGTAVQGGHVEILEHVIAHLTRRGAEISACEALLQEWSA